MKTKKDIAYSFNHTQERMKSRYNILMGIKDYTEMCECIDKKRDIKFVAEEKQKDDIQQIYDICFKGIIVRVVWSTANKRIKTVLTIEE